MAVGAVEAADMPITEDITRAGCWAPDWAHYLDPRALSVGLTSHLRERGVRFVRGEVSEITAFVVEDVPVVQVSEPEMAEDPSVGQYL